jgi:hypothetical protein
VNVPSPNKNQEKKGQSIKIDESDRIYLAAVIEEIKSADCKAQRTEPGYLIFIK